MMQFSNKLFLFKTHKLAILPVQYVRVQTFFFKQLRIGLLRKPLIPVDWQANTCSFTELVYISSQIMQYYLGQLFIHYNLLI